MKDLGNEGALRVSYAKNLQVNLGAYSKDLVNEDIFKGFCIKKSSDWILNNGVQFPEQIANRLRVYFISL